MHILVSGWQNMWGGRLQSVHSCHAGHAQQAGRQALPRAPSALTVSKGLQAGAIQADPHDGALLHAALCHAALHNVERRACGGRKGGERKGGRVHQMARRRVAQSSTGGL